MQKNIFEYFYLWLSAKNVESVNLFRKKNRFYS